ncbi:MAG: hypothetical protein QOF53_2628 [Nocardioidaceae bacterium]|nr:hypothetical protein [Nocardioidaceae bacterium]
MSGAAEDETAWPLLPTERIWRGRRTLWPGFLAMTAGAMIGMLLVTLAVVP